MAELSVMHWLLLFPRFIDELFLSLILDDDLDLSWASLFNKSESLECLLLLELTLILRSISHGYGTTRIWIGKGQIAYCLQQSDSLGPCRDSFKNDRRSRTQKTLCFLSLVASWLAYSAPRFRRPFCRTFQNIIQIQSQSRFRGDVMKRGLQLFCWDSSIMLWISILNSSLEICPSPLTSS